MKTTALTQQHKALNAKMVDFAGYQMPVSYAGVKQEHLTVRNKVGVFDVSHMGEFLVSGPGALPLLQKICSNDISKIYVGRAQYNYMPNENGGIVDDLIIYRVKEETYLLVVNAANIEKDWLHINAYNKTFNAGLKNISEDYALLAIQGPKAIEAMQSLSSVNLANIKFYHFKVGDFAGIPHVIISATGYTGSGGFEIYCKNHEVLTIWQKVLQAGHRFGIQPIGLAARDTLRLEMGYCLYGNDIDEHTSPIAAGLGWVTKFQKDFVNAPQLKAQKEQGTKTKLVAFTMQGKAIPRQGYAIVNEDQQVIGKVTSGTMSPSLNMGIGLGYVEKAYTKHQQKIGVLIRNKTQEAVVTKLPFYQP